MEELFWWAEDAEYCEWRIPEAGFPRRIIEDAVVHHDAIRQGGDIPTWKYYYESRNMLYYHLHVMHRVGRYPKKITSLVLRAILRQKKDRIGCLGAICRGLYDGAFSRLGIRYEVSSLHERDLSPSADPRDAARELGRPSSGSTGCPRAAGVGGSADRGAGLIAAQSPDEPLTVGPRATPRRAVLTSAPPTELAARGLASCATIIHELSSRPAMSSAV